MLSISTKWKKIIKSMSIHREKVIMIILTMTIALFSISTIFNTFNVLTNALNKSKGMSHPADLIFYTSHFQKSAIQDLNKTNGIAAIDERFATSARVKTAHTQYKNMQLVAVPDLSKMKLNILRDIKAQPDTGNILLEQSSTQALPLGSNKKISLQLPNGMKKVLTYKGSAYDFNQVPTKFSGVEYGYINFKTLKNLGVTPYYNQVLIQLDPNTSNDNQNKIISQFKEKLRKRGVQVYRFSRPEDVLNQRGKILHTILTLLIILGSLSLIFGSLLIINAITGIMSYERKEIGIMKSIGASRFQIMKLYTDMTLFFGFVSFVSTIPLIYFVSNAFSHFLARQLNIEIIHFHLSKEVIFFDLMISLLTPVLSAMKPIFHASKITVIEALDPFLRNIHSNVNKLFHKSRFMYRPFLLTIRNTFQKKGQLMLTLFTLTLGGTIILSVFNLQSSIKLTLKEITHYWSYDLKINFKDPESLQKTLDIADKVNGVASSEGWIARNTVYYKGNSNKKNSLLLALPSKTTMIMPHLIKGKWLNGQNKAGIVVNEDVLQQNNSLTVGDSLSLQIGKYHETRTITGVVRSQLMGPTIYMKKRDYDQLTGQKNIINQVVIKTKKSDAAFQMKTLSHLENKYNSLHMSISASDTNRDMRNRPKQMINIIDRSLLIMSIIIMIVDVLNLSTTMSIKVLDRKRDIGVMQSIGASNHVIRFLFITEAVILSLISFGISIALSIPLSFELTKIIGMALLGHPLTYSFSYNGLYLWLLISLLIPIIASYFPARKATRLTVSDILRYE